MLFNSYVYLFAFLPLVVFFYYLCIKKSALHGALALIVASIIYYCYWEPKDLIVLVVSIILNYNIGRLLSHYEKINFTKGLKTLLFIGVSLNIAALVYYKFTDFLIDNFNYLFGFQIEFLHLVMPLAISFFTFQQIAYLVESYRGQTRNYKLLDYILVVTFFPHLLAGPIVNYSEIMAQFSDLKTRILNYENLNKGLFLIAIGLFKKVVIADSFSTWIANGFDLAKQVNIVEAWASSLSYTIQLYFDFSGYSDIAIGSALLFNIKFPANFNSPYKAKNIQDFWRRWHISLSHFLRNHIYIPLGGNKKGKVFLYINLFLTFFIGGIWHGAGWTFVIWGALHGGAVVVHRMFQNTGIKIQRHVAWIATFLFANFAWVFFRARDWKSVVKILKGMLGLTGIQFPLFLEHKLAFLKTHGVAFGGWVSALEGNGGFVIIPSIVTAISIALFAKNSQEIVEKFKPSVYSLLCIVILFVFSVLFIADKAEFLYFNF